MMIFKIIALFILYYLLFGVKFPSRRTLIEEYVNELKQIEPDKKIGSKVLKWYNMLLDDNEAGHYNSYLTPAEFNIVKNFLYECGIQKMPAPEFRRRKGELSKIVSKTFMGILNILKVLVFVVVLFNMGKYLLLIQPSAIGLAKMWAFIIGMPLLFALICWGINFVQAADE